MLTTSAQNCVGEPDRGAAGPVHRLARHELAPHLPSLVHQSRICVRARREPPRDVHRAIVLEPALGSSSSKGLTKARQARVAGAGKLSGGNPRRSLVTLRVEVVPAIGSIACLIRKAHNR